MVKLAKYIVITILSITLTGCVIHPGNRPVNYEDTMEEERTRQIANAHEFDLELYKQVMEEDKNLIFSPYSIRDCFSLIYDAVDGTLREQMDDVLGFRYRNTNLFRKYDQYAKSDPGLNVANRVFLSDDFSLIDKSLFGTDDIEKIPMNDDGVKKINKFVDKNTKNMIPNMLKEGSLDGYSDEKAFVLVNAIYFNKSWNFEEKDVIWSNGITYPGFGDEIALTDVKELSPNIDLLRLRYEKKKDSEHNCFLYIICESENNDGKESVYDFVKDMTVEELDAYLDFSGYDGLSGYHYVDFKVPEFEMSSEINAKEALMSLGLTEGIKEATDDLSRLGIDRISDVLHKAHIKVDKRGTEAAAATAISFETCALPVEEENIWKHVIADEEFMFILMDQTSNMILFMGQVAEPEI